MAEWITAFMAIFFQFRFLYFIYLRPLVAFFLSMGFSRQFGL